MERRRKVFCCYCQEMCFRLAIPSVAIGIGGACRAGKLWASQFSDVVPFPIGGYILVGCLLLLFIVATVVLKAWCIANENPVKSIKSE